MESEVCYHVHNSLSLVPILSQIKSVHTPHSIPHILWNVKFQY